MDARQIQAERRKLGEGIFELVEGFQNRTGRLVKSITPRADGDRFGAPKLEAVEVVIEVDPEDEAGVEGDEG